MIVAEFRLIQSLANRDMDKFIIRFEMPETPGKGECINIDGEPYIVYSKGWAIGGDDDVNTYCYICVIDI